MPDRIDKIVKEYEDRLSNEKDFIMWVRNRLVNLFGDSPDAYWIKRLEDMSIFLPGPTIIPLTTRDQDPCYFRIADWQLQDLGDYYIVEKTDLERLRQYEPYREDPELVEQKNKRKEAINRRRNYNKETF